MALGKIKTYNHQNPEYAGEHAAAILAPMPGTYVGVFLDKSANGIEQLAKSSSEPSIAFNKINSLFYRKEVQPLATKMSNSSDPNKVLENFLKNSK